MPVPTTTSTTVPGLHQGTLSVRRGRLTLPPGAGNDRLTLRATLALAPGSDGIDPASEGFMLSLDTVTFTIPGARFAVRSGRWRYHDRDGLGSVPSGITDVVVRLQRDGTYRIVVRGRHLELSTFDGTNDRTINVTVQIGNDRGSASVPFRRVRSRDLRTP